MKKFKIKIKIKKKLTVVETISKEEAEKKYKGFIKGKNDKSIYVSKKYVRKGYAFHHYRIVDSKHLGTVFICEKCMNNPDSKKHYFIQYGSVLTTPYNNCFKCNHLIY